VPRARALRCSRKRSRHCQQQPEKTNHAVTVALLDLATAEPGTWLLLLLAVGTWQLLEKSWETFEGTFLEYFLEEEQQQQRVRLGEEKQQALQH